MSFEVKITAATLGELGDKLLAMGQSLTAKPNPVMPEVLAQVTNLEAAAKASQRTPKATEAIFTAQQESQRTPKAEKEAAIAEAIKETGPAEVEVNFVEPQPEQPTAEIPTEIDFDKDVAPRVLAVVQAKGKPVMQEILQEFGVERASQIGPDVLAEFIEVLDKELAA